MRTKTAPVKYIERTRAYYSAQGFSAYQWTVNESAPWTPLNKPLERCMVALLSTGGVFHKEQPPFKNERDDLTYREISKNVDVRDLRIVHYAYDHTDAKKDINCIFPIERFQELEAEGYIGELAPVAFTLMGGIFRRTYVRTEMAPRILQRLKDMKADVLFLVPA